MTTINKSIVATAALTALLAVSGTAFAAKGGTPGPNTPGGGTVQNPQTPAPSQITTKAGESLTYYFSVPTITVDKGDALAGTLVLTQTATGTDWSLGASFNTDSIKLSNLYFGYKGLASLAVSNFSTAGGFSIDKVSTNGNNAGVSFTTSKNNSFNEGESARWSFAGTDITNFTINGVHLNEVAKNTSAKYGVGDLPNTISPVPEPATYGMLAIGLAAVAFVARRRKADTGCATAPMMVAAA